MKLWKDSKGSRYWTDPEYRERKLRQAREARQRVKDDPDWKRIHYLETAMSAKRRSIEAHRKAIQSFERSLIWMGKELVKRRDMRKRGVVKWEPARQQKGYTWE